MKRKLGYLLSILLVLVFISYGIVRFAGKSHVITEETKELVIATSFYPVYIMALNLTDQVEGVRVVNLTENQTGCVHDYQLTTKDMRAIAGADIVILNGGEMEAFMEEVLADYPKIQVIDASEGMSFLEGSSYNHDHETTTEDEADDIHEDEAHSHETEAEHTHEEEEAHKHLEETSDNSNNFVNDSEEHVHNHSEINGHVWMNMERYQQQIATVAAYLCEYDSERAVYYENNARIYSDKVRALQEEYADLKEFTSGQEIIIFHDAFAYLADELGMEVVYAVDTDSESALSAGELAQVVHEINLHSIQYLFTEEQYSTKIANQVSAETGAKVYVMDSLVTGLVDKDSYLNGMKQNLELLYDTFRK